MDLPNDAASASSSVLVSAYVVSFATSKLFILVACAFAFACIFAALLFFRSIVASTSSFIAFSLRKVVIAPVSALVLEHKLVMGLCDGKGGWGGGYLGLGSGGVNRTV